MNDTLPPLARPSRVRFGILALTTLVAVLLYLDRYSLSVADRDIKRELHLEEEHMAYILGAFFLAYALCQIPFGYLSDRFGPRRMLTFYVVAWSGFTGLMGAALGFVDLLVYRMLCGVFEAGAFPACAGIIRRWIPYYRRGLASGIVSLGGRLGGAITPKLTASLMIFFATWYPEGAWRPVVIVYGLVGIVLAAVFWSLYRDSPERHPAVNEAEADLIRSGDPKTHRDEAGPTHIPWRGILTNVSLWLCSLVQFGINFGWVFLITYLNRYLFEVHGLPLETRGTMGTIVIAMSLPALFLGGWLTDRITRALGPRWGRALPLALTRFVSAAAFLAVLAVDDPWTIVVLLGLVAFFSDLGVPAIWAFNMDVGGRSVGTVLGWGNMWGNLGAALSPYVLNRVVTAARSEPDIGAAAAWDRVFLICGLVFVLVGIASLFVDATKRLRQPGV